MLILLLAAAAATAGCSRSHDTDIQSFSEQLMGSEERQRVLFNRTQDAIANCMAANGWTYTPMPFTPPDEVDAFGIAPDTFYYYPDLVPIYGYGGVSIPLPPPEEALGTDPNDVYLRSLTSAEQARYLDDMYGPSPEDPETFDPSLTTGCFNESNRAVRAGDPSVDVELSMAVVSLEVHIQEQPEVAEGWAKWRDCMRNNGHEFDSYLDAQQSIRDAIDAHGGLESIRSDDLSAIARTEIELATTDLDCFNSNVRTPLESARSQLQLELIEQTN